MKRYLFIGLLMIGCSKSDPGRSGGALPGMGSTLAPTNPSKPTPPPVTAPTLPTVDMFILQGQSNMDGRGAVQAANPLVTFVDSDPIGPGYEFANEYVQHTGKRVIMIECAVGGTTSEQWLPGGQLMKDCGDKVGRWQTKGDANYIVKGILSYQGEADGILTYPTNWSENFKQTIFMLRNFANSQTVPVVFAQIDYTTAPAPEWQYIQDQQASTVLANSRMIYTIGLPLQDHVHLTTESYVEVGRRMFQAYMTLQ